MCGNIIEILSVLYESLILLNAVLFHKRQDGVVAVKACCAFEKYLYREADFTAEPEQIFKCL